MNFSCRLMETSDIVSVLLLQEELKFLDWTKEQYIKELQSSSSVALVALNANEFVGFALFLSLGEESELLAIGISEKYQRCGLGKRLFKEGEKYLVSQGAKKLFLEVREHNEKAKEFYKNLGGKVIGTRKHYYKNGEAALLFQIDF